MFVSLYQITRESLAPYPGENIIVKEIFLNLDNVKYFKQANKVNDDIKEKGREIYGNIFVGESIGEYTTTVCFKDETEPHEIEVIEALDYIEVKIKPFNKK